jgi:hypothetical protein
MLGYLGAGQLASLQLTARLTGLCQRIFKVL